MKRRILSVLLAGFLLLQGNVWAAAEELAPGEGEWTVDSAEDSGQTEILGETGFLEEQAPEMDVALEGENSEQIISEADLILEDEISEEENLARDGSEITGSPDQENPEAGQIPDGEDSGSENPETEQAEEEYFGLEEEAPVLTIDAIEEVELSDIDAYVSDIADDADETAVPVDEQHFPDARFRTYVEGLDTDGDKILSAAEISWVYSIDVKGKRITSLIGIEYFTSLQTLNCSVNQLRMLDVSKNTALTELNCSNNQLTGLDVSRNEALSVLDCSSNKAGELNVDQNPELTVLKCGNNGLESLSTAQNPRLTVLNCTNNRLESLDVSKNPKLTELNCGNNKLTSLNVRQNTKLTALECYFNQLSDLDVSKNTELVTLFCYSNNLTSLDVSSSAGIETLSCGSNKLTRLSIGTGASLKDLNCEDNQLTNLDVSSYSSLRLVDCSRNQLKSFIIGNHTRLNAIECQENQLTSLDVSGDRVLQNLVCSSNQLTELDLTHKSASRHNDNLSWLDCSDNRLKALDLSGNPVVKQVLCENNQISALDVSGHTLLEILNCTGNQIESLNVSGCRSMTGLDCENNRLTSLDVGTNTALKYLLCGYNPLMSLDLSNNRSLEDLKCESLGIEYSSCSQNDGQGLNLLEWIKEEDLSRVTFLTEGVQLEGGVIKLLDSASEQFSYEYDTKAYSSSPAVSKKITVTLKIPAHKYTVIEDKKATCTEPGSRHRECTVCGYSEPTEEIPAAGHIYGDIQEEPATCARPGRQYHECVVCQNEETVAEIPATGRHSYGEYEVVKEPTALKKGLKTRTCSICGATESKSVSKLEATISLSADSIVLQKKQSTNKLTVSGLAKGDKVVSWKSSNKKIVTAESTGNLKKCTLTAKNKAGSAKITVELASGLKKKIKVTVQKDEVTTTKISGLEKNMTIAKGEKITLKPVITPITSLQEVTYQTSDKNIVTVNAKGVVKGVKKGKAKITVKSGNKKFVITMNIKKSKK